MFVNEIVNTKNTEDFESFMKGFRNLEYQKDFASNDTIKHDLYRNGFVSTYEVFNVLFDYSEPVQDVQEFLAEYGDMEVLKDTYDNTYNYNSPLDNYVNFSMFELENDQVLVTLSVCLGLDPRAGYTKQVAFVFENKDEFLEAFATNFELADFVFTANGKSYYGGFSANALSEFGLLSVIDRETDEEFRYDEVLVNADNLDDLKEAIADALEVSVESVKISRIDYSWDYIWEC